MREFLRLEKRQRIKNYQNNSTRVTCDTKEQSKKELLQYRIFENDSDEDVFEGLGNTTLDVKGTIAAGISSDEGSQGNNNIQS